MEMEYGLCKECMLVLSSVNDHTDVDGIWIM